MHHHLVGDLLTPRFLKHEAIRTQRVVIYFNPSNPIGSRVRRGNSISSRAKFCEGFTVLLLIFFRSH